MKISSGLCAVYRPGSNRGLFPVLLVCVATECAVWAAPDAASSKPILALDAGGHTDSVARLQFTPDGRELITASKDKTVRIWNVATGEALRVLRPPIGPGRAGSLEALAVSPNGRTLACAGMGLRVGDNPIYLIDYANGRIQTVLSGHSDLIIDLKFSPDGRRLVSCSWDRTARVWDVATGQLERTLEGHTEYVYQSSYSPDGQRLATASFDGTCRIWTLATGGVDAVLDHRVQERLTWVRTVAWSPDGETLATGGLDGCLRLWNTDGTLRKQFEPVGDQILSLIFTADSRQLVFTRGIFRRTDCSVFNIGTESETATFSGHTSFAWRAALSPDGRTVATCGFCGDEVFLWTLADGRLIRRLGGRSRIVWSAGWSPGWSTTGESIAWGDTGSRSDGQARHRLERTFRPAELAFGPAPDDEYRQGAPAWGTLSLHRIQGEDNIAVHDGDEFVAKLAPPEGSGPITCVAMVSETQAAVGTIFGAFLFDARSGSLLRSYEGHTGNVLELAPSADGRYLLSASSDETLRVWTLERDEPLFSLFVAGDDWVAWTPEGYYATSPGGERLMGWHVNNGPSQIAAFYPAAQFRKSLYRPDVIQRLLKAGSTEKALQLADQERGRVSQAARVEQVLPPQVRITSPAQPRVEVRQAGLEIRAAATPAGAAPVTAMRLLLDGRPYEGPQRNPAPAAAASATESQWQVQLDPGTHRIVVKAETSKSYGLSSPVEVTYAPQQTGLPSLYTLCVGVSQYEHKDLRLDYGAIDAQSLATAIKKGSDPLFRKVEQRVLTDAQATRQEILKGLEWLKSQMTQHDVGIVFFAGHGAKDQSGVFYLVPVDCRPEDLAISGISEDQIKRYCQSIPGRLILLLDACHTGALGGDKRRSLEGLTDNLVRDLVTDDYGVIVMCSSMGREVSVEQDDWAHGAFTKALIEGLQGAADYDRDGTVYLSEIDLYVTERVKGLTSGKQHPVTQKPTTIRSFPLGKPWRE